MGNQENSCVSQIRAVPNGLRTVNIALRRLVEWSKTVWYSLVSGCERLGRALRAAFTLAVCAVVWPVLLVTMVLLTLALLAGGTWAIVLGWDKLLELPMKVLTLLVCLLPSNSEACRDGAQPDLVALWATWLGALGAAAGLWSLARRHLANALRTVAGAVERAWKHRSFPPRPMEATVSEVFSAHVVPVLKEMSQVSRSWFWLASGLLLVGVALAFTHLSFKKTDKAVQTSVNQSLTQVVLNEVFVQNMQNIVEGVSDSFEARHHVYFFDSAKSWPSFKKGTVFSLVFPPEGDLRSKEGICPSDTAIDWMRDFRAALATCPRAQGGDGKMLELEVKAYSSIAPVRADGSYDRSDLLNCEIANQRASAVAHMLVARGEEYLTEDYCEQKLQISQAKRKPGALCTGTEDMAEIPAGPNFELIHTPWKSYRDMHRARPMDDGTREKRRTEAEFFNRVVQIIFKNDACWRPDPQSQSKQGDAT